MTIEYEGRTWEVVEADHGDSGGSVVTLKCVLVPEPLTDYMDLVWCNACGRVTEHDCHDEHHERDSSHDWKKCRVCGLRSQL